MRIGNRAWASERVLRAVGGLLTKEIGTNARVPAVALPALAYSVFQQGAGLVDAYGAVYSMAAGCAKGDKR